MAKTSPEKLAYAKAYREKNRDKLRQYFSSEPVLEKKRLRRRVYVAANREMIRQRDEAQHLKRYHRMTVEQFRAMAQAQAGKCAICGEAPSGQKHCGKLHVDHDHATGAIRDLLCSYCNIGLGKFMDSPLLLTKAAWYLDRHAKARRSA
jgi:hypothetical protein